MSDASKHTCRSQFMNAHAHAGCWILKGLFLGMVLEKLKGFRLG